MSGERKVAVFDLNGTLYNKSSKDEFYKFICSKRKSRLLRIFHMSVYVILQKLHVIGQTEFKENFFSYLDSIAPREVEALAREYWQQEYPARFNSELLNKVKYLKKHGVEVYCITGALELYVKPLFDIYKDLDGFAGTRVTYTDEKYLINGEACKGKVKLEMLKELVGTGKFRIVEAYSDSKEDILDAAERAFLVKEGRVEKYK